jgi:hypothetical protein
VVLLALVFLYRTAYPRFLEMRDLPAIWRMTPS